MRPELLDPEFLIAYLRDHTKFDANLVENIINEWKAYKATGLEPEGIKLMKEREEWQPMAKITQMCGVSLDRLRELAEADQDGRCMVLPCKVGDTVYRISQKEKVTTVGIDDEGMYVATNVAVYRENHFGTLLYLAREAAEAALEAQK